MYLLCTNKRNFISLLNLLGREPHLNLLEQENKLINMYLINHPLITPDLLIVEQRADVQWKI